MTPELVMAVLGLCLLPAIGWAIMMNTSMGVLKTHASKLLELHEHPEKTGFGTVGLQEMLKENQASMESIMRENQRTMRELVYYIRWTAEHTTGKVPPPPPPIVEGV